jgi:hypothetical protein
MATHQRGHVSIMDTSNGTCEHYGYLATGDVSIMATQQRDM